MITTRSETKADQRIHSRQDVNKPSKTASWAMVIDLRRCLGCKACAVVCSMSNNVPANSFRKVKDCGVLSPNNPLRIFVPTSCMHCRNPPCLEVCPTGATYRRADGIVNIDEEKCLGCGYCEVACPYRARHIYLNSLQLEICALECKGRGDGQPRQSGVSMKCNFCLPRIEKGLARNLRPGEDKEATPYCVINCSGGALHFGDLNDPESNVSKLLKKNKTIRLQEEAGTEPSVYYIDVI